MFQKNLAKILFGFVFFGLVFAASAQTKRKTAKKPVKKTTQTKPIAIEQTPTEEPTKKNERPAAENQNSPDEGDTKANNRE